MLRDDRATSIVSTNRGLVWRLVKGQEAPVDGMHRSIPEDISGFMVSIGIVKQSEVLPAKASPLARVLAIDTLRPTATPDSGKGTLVASVEDAVRPGVDQVNLLLP